MTGFEQEKIITRSSLLTCRIGMKRVLNSTPESFVTDVGIRVRRKIFRLLQKPLYLAAGKKIILERYPDLEPDRPYIFTSNHWFAEDFIAVLSCLDRNAFILFGSRDQVEHNPAMIFPWLNGIVFVDRMNKASRRDSVLKMVRLLNNGTSILLFPEGTYNSSENLLCLKLFPGPYTLNQETGVPVIPIAVYTLPELTSIYVNFGNPMDFGSMGQAGAMELLRDTLASMHYEHIIKLSRILFYYIFIIHSIFYILYKERWSVVSFSLARLVRALLILITQDIIVWV